LRVLLIDVNCKHSSTGKIVYDLYTELNKNGHTAAICYGRGPLVKEPNIYKFGIDIETYTHALLTRVTGLTGIYSPFSTRRLIKYLEKFKPDVVHIHELHAYFVNNAPVICYLKKKNIRTVWTFHCEFMYTGKCGQANDCEKWRSECGNCPQLKEYPASWWFDFTRKMHNDKKRWLAEFERLMIVTPSKWLADRVEQSFLKGKDIRVIHNGIDTEMIFYPREHQHLKKKHGLTNEKIVLAVAPNLMSESKGGKWVVELAKEFTEEDVRFILIGVDNSSQRYADNIIAINRIANQAELAEYYSLADAFVICSERESFPTTCLEALACGAPIVGFDCGGTKEVPPDYLGDFVDFGDIVLLKKALCNKLQQNIEAEKCAGYGKKAYAKERMFNDYLSLYEE